SRLSKERGVSVFFCIFLCIGTIRSTTTFSIEPENGEDKQKGKSEEKRELSGINVDSA
ncbi:hypothetical protein SAMN05421787_1151, partial [Virgibacillus pantothenticus]